MMTFQSVDSIKERIKMLLRVAKDDAATEGEINNALGFAKKLILAHHLNEDELWKESSVVQNEMKQYKVFCQSNGFCAWESVLAGFVGRTIGSIYVYHGAPEAQTSKNGILRTDNKGEPIIKKPVIFVGETVEAELAKEMFKDLYTLTMSMAKLRTGTCFRGPGKSYAEGFVSGLIKKAEIQDALLEKTTGRELVVKSKAIIEYKQKEVSKYMESRGIRLGKTKQLSSWGKDYNFYGKGFVDGNQVNVDQYTRRRIEG